MSLVYLVISLVILLVGISFFTLIEQKVLGARQVRLGPFYRGFLGLLQPFSDALKLYRTGARFEIRVPGVFLTGSCLGYLSLCLGVWISCPFFYSLFIEYRFVYILFIIGVSSIPFLFISWYRNCKYRIMGGLRVVSQVVSYEVSCAFLFIRVCILVRGLRFSSLAHLKGGWLIGGIPLLLLFIPSFLAERIRSPFDFREGESELVSGFNTELGGSGFAFCFIGEYLSMIFIRFLFLFIFSIFNLYISLLFCRTYSIFLVLVRCLLPRFRYDKLITFCWKYLLPLSLFCFYYYSSVSFIEV